MPFSGTGTDMSIKLHSGQRRALMWKIESASPAKYIYRLLFFANYVAAWMAFMRNVFISKLQRYLVNA